MGLCNASSRNGKQKNSEPPLATQQMYVLYRTLAIYSHLIASAKTSIAGLPGFARGEKFK